MPRPFRVLLTQLQQALEEAGDQEKRNQVADVLAGTDEDLIEYLQSNSLWGGCGSIADQGGFSTKNQELRHRVEAALIELGQEQINAGTTNLRTAKWIGAFREWRDLRS